MSYLLAGDVGGTKTVLGLYQTSKSATDRTSLREIHKAVYPSSAHPQFAQLVSEFLAEVTQHRPVHACFGIAGPVQHQRCNATNLPWVIDAQALSENLHLDEVYLLNDLEAAAYGMLQLSDDDFIELNPQASPQPGHLAVIGAGTGLGEAILAFDGQQHIALPTEGGHCDFGPNSTQEDALLRFLRQRFAGHVSLERILAGDGFGNLYDFLHSSGYAQANPAIEQEMTQGDRNAVISRYGLAGEDPLCSEVMRLFVRIYGSETGNLALKCLPRAGIYIGGGIGPRIRSALEDGEFMRGYLDKGRMARAIQHIPVRLSLNPEAPLLGAAHMAAQRIRR